MQYAIIAGADALLDFKQPHFDVLLIGNVASFAVLAEIAVSGRYNFNLDEETAALNADGFEVKQVSTTTFIDGGYPILAVTFLVEREAHQDNPT